MYKFKVNRKSIYIIKMLPLDMFAMWISDSVISPTPESIILTRTSLLPKPCNASIIASDVPLTSAKNIPSKNLSKSKWNTYSLINYHTFDNNIKFPNIGIQQRFFLFYILFMWNCHWIFFEKTLMEHPYFFLEVSRVSSFGIQLMFSLSPLLINYF